VALVATLIDASFNKCMMVQSAFSDRDLFGFRNQLAAVRKVAQQMSLFIDFQFEQGYSDERITGHCRL
jgi:hypothetical protein